MNEIKELFAIIKEGGVVGICVMCLYFGYKYMDKTVDKKDAIIEDLRGKFHTIYTEYQKRDFEITNLLKEFNLLLKQLVDNSKK